jgi:hypothetical protein
MKIVMIEIRLSGGGASTGKVYGDADPATAGWQHQNTLQSTKIS